MNCKIAKIQTSPDYVYLYGDDNKVIRSEAIPASGVTVMAIARLRTFAKRNGIEVK